MLKRVSCGTGEKLFNPSDSVMFCDYCDYLSYKKYSCVNHFPEFCSSNNKYLYHRLMILNGHSYKYTETRYSNLALMHISQNFLKTCIENVYMIINVSAKEGANFEYLLEKSLLNLL